VASVKRHPFRAFFGGLLLGLGVALLLVVYAKVALGRPVFWVLIGALAVVSTLLALFAPPRRRYLDSKAPPASR
jgi:hypothetical protein